MGMFDYVTHEGKEYQCKDTLAQYMEHYRIVDGRLLHDEVRYEEVPKAERPYPNDDGLLGWMGSQRRVPTGTVDQNWDGDLYLTADKDEGYATYRATFRGGNLVEFGLAPRSGPSAGAPQS